MIDLIYGLAVAGAQILVPIFSSTFLPRLAGKKLVRIFKGGRKK